MTMRGQLRHSTIGPAGRRRTRFGDLPLSWKLLLPSVGLIVVLGIAGGFLIVRDLSERSRAALDLELSRRTLDAAAVVRDQELSLIEALNFAANVEGVAAAIADRDAARVGQLLRSVVALKTDLELLVAADRTGRALVELSRDRPGERPRAAAGADWATQAFVRLALAEPAGSKTIGFSGEAGRSTLSMAAPICTGTSTCDAVGVAIAGVPVRRVAEEALARMASGSSTESGLTIFDESGTPRASAGRLAPLLPREGSASARWNATVAQTDVAILAVPLEAGEQTRGTLAVAVPLEPTLASVRRTGVGLGLVLLAAMIGIALVGVAVSRLILRQIRSLVATNRALGQGDLSARAEVRGGDEIGELAARINEMAEQLQAMYQTLEYRVAERTEEVERLLRERTEFFASVSHELRTPLAVILRHAEMLLDDAYRGNGRWRRDAGSALKDSGGQLARLIDDILELAEVEAGRMRVNPEPVALGDFLHELRPTIVPLARAAGLTLTIRGSRDAMPSVMADPRRLRQILVNLVDNAVKYTPEGGRIEITTTQRGSLVEISVADTGVGIPAGTGDRIFEPFFRVKDTRPQRGQASSGLGLSVVRRLVEAHGGTVGYAPRDPAGTIFTFTLADAAAGVTVPARPGALDDETDDDG